MLKKKGEEACICTPPCPSPSFKTPIGPSFHQALEFYIVLVFTGTKWTKNLYLALGKHGSIPPSVTCYVYWMS